MAALLLLSAAARAAPTQEARWLGDDLPLPLPVKTPQDIGFKAAAERQYLIFNLMAGGKLAYEGGDFSGAAEKWDTLLRIEGLDPQVAGAVAPFLADARSKLGKPSVREKSSAAPEPAPGRSTAAPAAASPGAAPPRAATVGVSGTVSGGGQIGPGGAVVWLRRVDAPSPRPAPAANQVITQRDKTFLPHVLPVPVGTTVQFRNDDRIYHNVFSLAKPNDFDAGIRATGATYTKTFTHPGAVPLLCNIHSTMNAYVFVVDSSHYAKAQASGAFVIRGVPPGRYELAAWHEAASVIARQNVTVGPAGAHNLTIAVGADKRPAPFVPDKYGHKRQPQLGY